MGQENTILFLSHLLQGEHSITLGNRVVVMGEVGCCVSLHSGRCLPLQESVRVVLAV